MGKPWFVDNTMLSDVGKCETKAYIRHACHLTARGEQLPLIAGQAFHHGLACWLNGDTPEQATAAVEEMYQPAVDRYLEQEERQKLAPEDRRFEVPWVVGIFHQYVTRYDGNWHHKAIGETTEKPVQTEFGMKVRKRDVIYVARLDAIVRKWESGGRWSMDHKTTRKITEWWIGKQKISSQFSGQTWIGRHNGMDIQGVVVNGIELPDPHKSDAKCRVHKVSYQECTMKHAGDTFIYATRGPAEMAAWEHSARGFVRDLDSLLEHYEQEGIEGVADVPMRGRFNDSCTFCEYKKWCDLGRNTSKAAIRATFTENTWDPTAVGE